MTSKTDERIEEVARDFTIELETLAERVKALELEGDTDTRASEEQIHQAEWYATFNAVVSGLMAQATHASDSDAVFSAATTFANRVHGLLETTDPGAPIDEVE